MQKYVNTFFGWITLKKSKFGNQPIDLEEKSDKVLFARYFLLMYIGIDIFFILVNLFYPDGNNLLIILGLLISVFCLYLLRRGWRNTAILIQLIRTNYIAFFFTYYDPNLTGNFLYFIVSGIGAMALYHYGERWKGILFSVISLALFYGSVFRMDEFKPPRPHFFFIMNFTIAYVMGFIIIYFLNKLNFVSQQKIKEQNKQLKKVNSELDRFVYSASHDLRAPLSSISGLIQLCERASTTEETVQYLNLMKDRIARLEQFIRDLINFSRNARLETRLENVDVKDLVHETFESLKFISGAESMTLQDNIPASAPVAIDKTRLQIVLFNLISNAIQYRNPQIQTSYIRINSKRFDDRLWLQIEDNGIGIDQLHQAKVFDMFYRASENSKGSGLGLYIVKEAVEKLSGTIVLHSALGEGTQFTLELPIQRN